MLHPVLPPTPPPITEARQPANLTSSANDTKFNSLIATDTGTQENQQTSQQQQATSQTQPNPQNLTRDKLVVSPNLNQPNPPKTFPPEFSPVDTPIDTPMSAALLGEPMGIAYPLQNNSDRLDVKVLSNPNATTNQNSFVSSKTPANPQVVAQNPQQPQLVQNTIEFKSRNPTPDSPAPSSIEFQTPQPQPPAESTNQPQSQPSGTTPPATTAPATPRTVEVISDRQVYDDQRRIVTAEGNVVVRFDGAVVDADRLQISLDNLIAVGEGNVALTRGDQVLRGQRFTYNFIQDSGELEKGRGEIYLPTAERDVAFLPTDVTAGGVSQRPVSDRIRANQPLTGVNSPGGIDVVVGGRADARNIAQPKSGGIVNRLRFEAEQIQFYPRGWQAKDVSITNDPFSPPELVLRAANVTLTREAPLVDRVRSQGSRVVFDQKVAIGIPREQQEIDRRERDVTPAIVSPGFDGDQRGGLYLERSFAPITTDKTNWTITPQFFLQKAVEQGTGDFAGLFGIRSRLNVNLNPKSVIEGNGELTSLNLSKVEDNFRASLRLRQTLGDRNPHLLNLEYSYRDRLYNGTLGYQTVQSSLGGVVISPIIPLGNSGINLSYQAGAQYINANTDRPDLLSPDRDNDRISLGRIQGSAALSGGLLLWQGQPLPPTATEGLRYTPNSVVPYLRALAGVTGTTSYYSNGDNQSTLIGTIGLEGQIGHFSRPYLDYTAFNVSYSQGFNSGLSPFLFDRAVDTRVLSAGITQQIYGPFRIGFQTSVNLDTGRESSTDYILEYSRRTYGLTLRYNPVLQLGGISFRISDFNWSGGTDPFSGQQVKPVVGGVTQQEP
ncbi:DUF3769 domain-containing protein [Calothrix sp. FACHB-1219]|uniref:DUF3769 domain-containing protein n=1 Tax=unclassified Calothrix TaxID=2619626 RepID=UPI0016829D5A|nr:MULTISPECIES: DUF3769 domain-containing protein [unclassified Calothrix]MBD2202304.1 DUF3769 domain-containing protein [Calothrix sp. FACHB-168]MBD2217710.1 DUF3769 domain-containing protein [Calothrix sp. FACHB-1219]